MKKMLKLTTTSVFLLSILLFSACNNQSKTSEKTETSLKELKEELRDVGQAIDNLADNESQEFKSDAEEILNSFNQKIDNFERKLEETDEKVGQETQEAIADLKAKEEKLEEKLEKAGDNTQDNWIELKKELKHDFSEFGSSVKNFFNDNV